MPRTLDDRVRRLEEDRDAMHDILLDIQATVAANAVRLDRLEGDVTELKGDVTELKGDVAGIKGDVTGIKGDVAELKTGMAEVLRRLPESR